jgi:hypothetical protein
MITGRNTSTLVVFKESLYIRQLVVLVVLLFLYLRIMSELFSRGAIAPCLDPLVQIISTCSVVAEKVWKWIHD